MSKDKKLTLEDLLARKEQRSAEKIEYKEVFVPRLDGCLVVKKLPLSRFLSLLEGQEGDGGLRAGLESNTELIYQCCPLMQDKRLQAEYECAEPTDIVCRLLEDDLGAINALANEILGFYGLSDATEDIKNGSGATASCS